MDDKTRKPTRWEISHECFGKVGEFTMRVIEGGGYAFKVASPTWYHGNLATEWITRQMNGIGQSLDHGFKAEHRYPKWCRCHTKKRFKKLWMSLGHGKKSAEAICRILKDARPEMSYQEAWEIVIFDHPHHKLRCRCLNPADNPARGSE